MYNNVSEQFATTIRSPSRTFNLRLKINGKWIDAGFKKMSYETASTSDEGIQIGSAVAAKIELTVKRINELFENTEIPIEIGLKLPSGKYEYIPLGFFTAEHPTLDQATTTFTAYDRMMKTTGVYVSELTYPASAESVLKEISTGCGVPCNVSGLNGITIDTAPVGYTYREVIGYIASLAGGFACVDRTGTIVIKWYEDNDYTINESRIMTFEKNESDYHLDYLTCNVDSNTSFTAGSGTLGITFDNPLMTEEKLNSVYKKVRGFAYRGASLKTLGDIRLDPWDIVTVEESGETYKVPVMNITQEYDGGLAMTITAYGKTETETETDYKGPSTKLAERTYAEMMLTKELVSKKVDAEWVKANTVTAETIVSVNNELQYIKNNYLKSNEADIKFATIEEEKVIKSDIEHLNAGYEKVGILDGDVADIKTLMFGSASGGSLTTEFSNAIVSLIGDAQIKSAMIESIDAKKITALDINTTSMKIHSESGLSYWQDNTIVISDGTRTRVQLGKDASADYNMYIWDKAGNLMFDALGLTAKGIQREIIRNDMVSQDAGISAEKLDIGSLFDVINKDGSHTLKSSKIYVDVDNQTLDVSFKTITTKTNTAVEAANKAAESANNALSAANSADAKAQSVVNKANAGEFKGDKGDTGAKGDQGEQGPRGLQGLQGEKGNQGIPGTNGTNGKTSYLHIAYANSADGKTGFDVSNSTGKMYIGQYTDFVQSDSTDPTKYSWTKIKGDTGAKGDKGDKGATGDKGETGNGVKQITPQYYLSTSNTTQSGGSWGKTRPAWISGRYYWTRDYILWTDGSVTYSTPQLATDLNNLYSSLQTVTNTVSSQGTQLSTVQGQISSKVWQQDITTAVTSLEIGGRNLLQGSKSWTKDNPAKSTDAPDGYAYIGGRAYLENGKTYTLQAVSDSVWATGHRGQTGEATIWLHGLEDGFHRVFCGDGKTSGRYTWTFVHTSATQKCEIRINGYSKVTSFWDIKIESGNKATDWTPAPEDIDYSIVSVEKKVTTVSNQYTSLNQALTSLTATVNSNTTAISKKADGSTVTSLQSNITALQADLGGFKTTVSDTYATKTSLNDYATTTAMNSAINQSASSVITTVSANYATKSDINSLQIGGVNRFVKGTVTKNKYITSTGAIMDGGNYWDLTDYIDVSKWTNYVASGWTNLGNAPATCFFDSNKKFISGVADKSTGVRGSLAVPANATYMRFSFAHVDTDKLKIEKGTKATDYSPAPEDVNAKFSDYATTASLSAYIAKTDTGALKSCIEAIADTINITARGGLNISGNRFTLASTNTTITADGTIDCKKLKAVNADLEGTFKNVNVTTEGITMTTTLIGGEYLMKSSTGAYLKIQGHFINLSNEDGTRNAVSIRRDGIYVDDYYYIRSGDAYYNLMDWIRHSETAGTVDISGNNCYIEGYYYIRHHGEWWKLEDYVKDIANN